MANINETLKQLRLDRGMTQEQVAEQVGLTRQAVSSYESGRTQPGIDILQRLADVYEADLTDIIYGRSPVNRLHTALKGTAIAAAAVILAAQLLEALLRWIANQLFPLTPGAMSDAESLIWLSRSKLMDAWDAVGAFYTALFPLLCVAVLVLTLCQRRPLSGKTKLLSVLGFVPASAVVVLPWALTDPFYPPVNYLIQPALCLAQLAFFLLLSLVIDFFRVRKFKRSGSPAEEPDHRSETTRLPVYKRWWFWILIAGAAAALVLIPISLLSAPDTVELPPVEDPAFTLNGVDYPQHPVLQDFLDRGWKVKKPVSYSGNYSEEEGVTQLVESGYELKSGDNHVTVYLKRDDLSGGVERDRCRINSLSVYGYNVMSFSVNGAELSDVTRDKIESLWGEPYNADELLYGGRTYQYSLPEQGIPRLSLTFKNSTASVGQIMAVFYSVGVGKNFTGWGE